MELIAAFQQAPWFYIGVMVVLGLMVGSFLNVVIHRLPIMMESEWRSQCQEYFSDGAGGVVPEPAGVSKPRYNLIVPRSTCPSCGHKITALENIPVMSFLFLRGKCAACKARISIRYPLVEVLTGALTGLLAWHFGVTWTAAFAILFAWTLVALTFIDADTTLLPDDLTLPLLWLGLLINLGGHFAPMQSAVLGAVAGYLVLWLVFWGFKLLTGKDGMGYGDFKLLAALGAWMGWQMLPLIILLSAAVGAVIGGIGILLYGRDKGAKLPFGPYLAMAGLIALIWGDAINRWYLNMPA